MDTNAHPRTPKLTGGAIERRLAEFEQKYSMGCQQFLIAYNAGSLDDNADYADWSGLLSSVSKPAARRRATA